MEARIRSMVLGVAHVRDADPQLAPVIGLAERLGSELHVVHAFAFVAAPGRLDSAEAGVPQGSQARGQELVAALEAQIASVATRGSFVCHVVPASPAEAILDVADREGADLVVVGASRRGPVASTLLGTTPQRVLRASRVPVLVIRGPGHDAPRRILLTTDLSGLGHAVHQRGLQLVDLLWGSGQREVRLLHVAGDDVLLPTPVQQLALREHAEARLASFMEETGSGGRGLQPKVRLGLSVREILAEAEEWGAHVLVLGTRGRTGFSRFLIGSVAESVSRKAPCDVLMIPATAMEAAPPPGSDDRTHS